jgi:protein O-GlcNAc transferase
MFDWLRGRKNRSEAAAPPGRAAEVADDVRGRAREARESGNAHLAQDRFGEAARCYEQAVQLDATDAAAWVNLGFAECSLGLRAQAREHLQKAVALQPDNHDAHYLLGSTQEQLGDMQAAALSLQRTLQLQPSFELAYRDLCRVLFQAGRFDEAAATVGKGLALNPGFADLHFYQGNLRMHEQQFAQAAASFLKALSIDAAQPQVHVSLGNAYDRQGQWELAAASYERALALGMRDAPTLNLLGTVHMKLGHLPDALQSYQEAIRLDPSYAQAHSNLGNALRLQGSLPAALQSCQRAVQLQPQLPDAHNNLGTVLMELKDAAGALSCFDRAIELNPEFAEAFSNRGVALTLLMRPADALASHERALRINPAAAEALNNQGNALLDLDRPEEALASFDEALRIHPDYPEALTHRGNALHRLGKLDAALESHVAALKLRPSYVDALNNRGNVLVSLRRFDEAVEQFDRALAVDSELPEVRFNRGNALRTVGRLVDAVSSYERALKQQPDLPFLFGNWLHAKMQICDWNGLEGNFEELARRVESDTQVFNPFTVLATPLNGAQQRRVSESYVRHQLPLRGDRKSASVEPMPKRLRVGYFSADFHDHATAYLMAELFEQHDRSRFELVAFSFGPTTPSAMRTRLEKSFDQFLVVNSLSDREISEKAREAGIDIAVDLKGFTQNCRPGIFAHGAAPVQASYLGYPGTMGADFIDYLIADEIVVPAEHRSFYSEKIAYLPGSYQVNDSKRAVSDRIFTRAEAGLPEHGFVFCCFNNNYKITPRIFDVWMRLLDRAADSVLWLLEANPQAAENLRAHAAARGVAPHRLVFAPRMDLPEHLARHRLADLFLDTINCNAHTTASDALWTGLPVLTCIGETFAGRVAASLLHAVQMPEMIANSLEEYEALAGRLASEPELLAAMRAKLDHDRLEKPLFDARRFARHIESAYLQMAERSRAGLQPDHIFAGH